MIKGINGSAFLTNLLSMLYHTFTSLALSSSLPGVDPKGTFVWLWSGVSDGLFCRFIEVVVGVRKG